MICNGLSMPEVTQGGLFLQGRGKEVWISLSSAIRIPSNFVQKLQGTASVYQHHFNNTFIRGGLMFYMND